MSGLETRKKSKICRHELSSSTQLMKNWIEQQLLRNVQNSRAKRVKQLFFLVEYAKLWGQKRQGLRCSNLLVSQRNYLKFTVPVLAVTKWSVLRATENRSKLQYWASRRQWHFVVWIKSGGGDVATEISPTTPGIEETTPRRTEKLSSAATTMSESTLPPTTLPPTSPTDAECGVAIVGGGKVLTLKEFQSSSWSKRD